LLGDRRQGLVEIGDGGFVGETPPVPVHHLELGHVPIGCAIAECSRSRSWSLGDPRRVKDIKTGSRDHDQK